MNKTILITLTFIFLTSSPLFSETKAIQYLAHQIDSEKKQIEKNRARIVTLHEQYQKDFGQIPFESSLYLNLIQSYSIENDSDITRQNDPKLAKLLGLYRVSKQFEDLVKEVESDNKILMSHLDFLRKEYTKQKVESLKTPKKS